MRKTEPNVIRSHTNPKGLSWNKDMKTPTTNSTNSNHGYTSQRKGSVSMNALQKFPRRRTTIRVVTTLGTLCVVILVISASGCKPTSKYQKLIENNPIVALGTTGEQLFQAHCAACHGKIGNSKGIAAYSLDVVPRNFWEEPFRYVSTLDGIPTREDLKRSIRSGRLHGQMPSSPSLSDNEIDSLTNYILEINRLGWVDRLTTEFGDDPDMTPDVIQEIATERVTALELIEVTTPGTEYRYDRELARNLYLQSCASCHGTSGRGDGLDMPLDDLGRPIKVRDLVTEPIRGGSDPIELFKRIRCGIPGTPMPAQEGFSDEQVWQLVHYTKSLIGGHVN